ncbi:FkbM family methyltransferase [Agrobacterium rubi]|uniref:FkbM family methyltransferase n=1 Tax=Agrobacterium rubi TaxID=28099 RepID=UPI0015724676|nr:FkbM family methyltransferase [Agrobacterium rubi]NTF06313.1 FkbM family methyltransferase [Agrobacterium rubi]NTF18554.1 FkbM family methyltransferase [Agrobacterium rubi]NTF25518.1 FkbM family methyltransferase [Agrobacterium rubi]
MLKTVRHVFQNPFITNECNNFSINPAPIVTNIYETYGQCNEDIIIESVLRAQMRRSGRQMESIRYIEIGANHPFQTSSTYLLYKLYGATGVLVEPIPALAETLAKARPNDTIANCAVTVSHEPSIEFHVHEKSELSSVSTDHISIFQQFGGTEKIVDTISCKNMHINDFMKTYYGTHCDYLSVDVEGLDAALLSEMDTVFQPTLIQCEHEGNIEEFASILKPKGYSFLAQTDVNAIFVKTASV